MAFEIGQWLPAVRIPELYGTIFDAEAHRPSLGENQAVTVLVWPMTAESACPAGFTRTICRRPVLPTATILPSPR